MKRFSLNSKRRKMIAAGGLLAASIVLASAFLVGSGARLHDDFGQPEQRLHRRRPDPEQQQRRRRHPDRQPHEADRCQVRLRHHPEHR